MYYKITLKKLPIITFIFITLLFIGYPAYSTPNIYTQHKHAISNPQTNTYSKRTSINKNEPLTIVGLGDSLTYGTGDTLGNGYIKRLEKILTTKKKKVNTINLAVSGATTNDLITMINKPVIEKTLKKAHIICITIGGNDLLQMTADINQNINTLNDTHINETWANSYTILAKLRKINSNAYIYWLNLYNPFEIIPQWQNVSRKYVLSWNQNLDTLTTKFNKTTTISVYNLFINNPQNYLYEDNFHPNSLGYRLIAQKLSERVLQDLNTSKHSKPTRYSQFNKIITRFKN